MKNKNYNTIWTTLSFRINTNSRPFSACFFPNLYYQDKNYWAHASKIFFNYTTSCYQQICVQTDKTISASFIRTQLSNKSSSIFFLALGIFAEPLTMKSLMVVVGTSADYHALIGKKSLFPVRGKLKTLGESGTSANACLLQYHKYYAGFIV